jgi:hypothetical protein
MKYIARLIGLAASIGHYQLAFRMHYLWARGKEIRRREAPRSRLSRFRSHSNTDTRQEAKQTIGN